MMTLKNIGFGLLLVGSTLFSIKARSQNIMRLYDAGIPGAQIELSPDEQPTMTVYRPVKPVGNTAVIIFPGGAYGFLATSTEGTPIGVAFAEKGITAVVIKYRLPNDGLMKNKSVGPLLDAQQAIYQVRKHAKEWNIDPRKIGVVGFSAGGHLAGSLATHYQESLIENKEHLSLRPDFVVLLYPVISMKADLTHTGSRINLLGNHPSDDLVKRFSCEEQVTADTPPTYLTHTADDQVVNVHNSMAMYEALMARKIPAELHLFPYGDHGFIQRQPVDEWLNPILRFMSKQGF